MTDLFGRVFYWVIGGKTFYLEGYYVGRWLCVVHDATSMEVKGHVQVGYK